MHIGGAERVVANLVRDLDPERFEVALCCTKALGVLAERLRTDSCEVVLAAPGSRRLRHLTPGYLHRAIARLRPDIVHTHGTPALLHAGPLAVAGLLPPWIHTFHYGNYALARGRHMVAERLLCRAATALVAVAEPQRLAIIEKHGLNRNQVVTVLNGVPPNPFLEDAAVRAARRAEFGFQEDEVVIGCVAVLSEQKGITYLLQAVNQVAARAGKARFLIAGGGPLEHSLRREAEELGLGSRVVFTGWRTDNLELLTALDVFVMSSLWEAMPMALLEAMAVRRPIVVTDVGDNRAIVDDGTCGMLIPPRDPGAIADAIASLVDRPDLARSLAARGYRRFEEQFTTTAMAASYAQIYERALLADGATRAARAASF